MRSPKDWSRVAERFHLSARELEVGSNGRSKHGVAAALGISAGTVHACTRRIYQKRIVHDQRDDFADCEGGF